MGSVTYLAAEVGGWLAESGAAVTAASGVVAGGAAAAAYWATARQKEKDVAQVESLQKSLETRARVATIEELLGELELQSREIIHRADELPNAAAASRESNPLGEIRGRAAVSYQILTDHYGNALTQSRMYFLLSYIVGIIGFLVMLGGVGIAYSGSLEPGVLASVVGLVVDGAAGLVFVQANRAQSNSQDNLKQVGDTVKEDNNRETALHLVSMIDDPDLRNEVLGDLARRAMETATYRPTADPDAGNAKQLPEGRSTNAPAGDEFLRPRGKRDPQESA